MEEIIEHKQQVYHLTIGPHEPEMKLEPSQRVHVTVPDCGGLGSDGELLPAERFEKKKGCPQWISNPMAGPYYIEGAQVGDSITVHIEDIKFDRSLGRTWLSPTNMHLPPPSMFLTEADKDQNVVVPSKLFRWEVDQEKGVAAFKLEKSRKKSVEVKLHPFIGCIAVAPEHGEFLNSVWPADNYGGNLDIPGTGPGASIHLPVFYEGANLFMGDLHAAQGQGEVIGSAIEISGSVTFSVEVNKGKTIAWPRQETAEYIGVMAAGGNLELALQIAYSQLVLWMSEEYGFDRWEALNIASQTAIATPGRLNKTIMCSINKSYL